MRRPLLEKARDVKQKVETVKAAVKVVQAVNEFRDARNKQDDDNQPIKTVIKAAHAIKSAHDRVETFQENVETIKTVAKVVAVAVVAHTAHTNHMDKVNTSNNQASQQQSYAPPLPIPVAIAQKVVANLSIPSAPPSPPTPPTDYSRFMSNYTFNEGGAREFMSQHHWPTGLQDTFICNLSTIALRFTIGDDSGSMGTKDGMLVVGDRDSQYKSFEKCTRWAELVNTLQFHSKLARAAAAPTEFRLLNLTSHDPLLVGAVTDGKADLERHNTLISLLDSSPNGRTPLCGHIRQVTDAIRVVEYDLRRAGKKVLLTIATDGEATDGDLAQAMRPLTNLPVVVLIRFCTSEQGVLNYWNKIDQDLELHLDVVDDLLGEAKEVHRYNPWLTYGEPLQRLREFGCSVKEIDLLDERKLTLEEVRKVCSLIFGGSVENYPHPEVNWDAFLKTVEEENYKAGMVWSPMTKQSVKWVNTHMLTHVYKNSGCCVVC